MSGTLVVQNLQGPASGANANKIIVPAGQVLDASAGFVAPAGSVIQVVSFETASITNTSSTSFVASLITVSITPSSATSKILVTASTNGYAPVNYSMFYTFFRNNSVELSGGATGYGGHWIAGQRAVIPITLTHLDSPNTTSATSYTVYFRGDGATVDTPDNGIATITAMEIAG